MATALVGSPTSQTGQEGQFRDAEPAAPEALEATRDMCAYCFGECYTGRCAFESVVPRRGRMALKVESGRFLLDYQALLLLDVENPNTLASLR